MFQEVDLLPSIPKESHLNLSCPFEPSENIVGIKGLTILLPIESPIRTERKKFKIWLCDDWKLFLARFRDSISEIYKLKPEYPLKFKIFYHVIEDPKELKEFVLGILEDPTHKLTIQSFYCLDKFSRRVSVLGDDGWRKFESYQTPYKLKTLSRSHLSNH